MSSHKWVKYKVAFLYMIKHIEAAKLASCLKWVWLCMFRYAQSDVKWSLMFCMWVKKIQIYLNILRFCIQAVPGMPKGIQNVESTISQEWVEVWS